MNPDFKPTLTQPGVKPVTPPQRRSLRSWFWPGFAAGFLLLSLLSCGGLVMVTGLNRIDLEDIQGSGAVWTPPAVTPTPTPDPNVVAPAAAAGTGAFQLGETVHNITSSLVRIRQTPGYLGKLNSDILVQIRPGESVEIIGEPAMADDLIWWRARYTTNDGRVIEGWVAEANQSGVQILGR